MRSARVPRAEASVVDAGAVVLRTVVGFEAFFTARDAACPRCTVGFFAVDEAVPAVAFRAAVPVREGFVTIVPEDVTEETVPVLFFRSPWRVVGRGGSGDFTGRGPVAARAVVFLACVGCCQESLTVDVVAPRGRELGPAERRGLEGLSGEVGRDK